MLVSNLFISWVPIYVCSLVLFIYYFNEWYTSSSIDRRRVDWQQDPINPILYQILDIVEAKRYCTEIPAYCSNPLRCDCSKLCYETNAVKFSVTDSNRYIINGKQLLPGDYCTTDPIHCNGDIINIFN